MLQAGTQVNKKKKGRPHSFPSSKQGCLGRPVPLGETTFATYHAEHICFSCGSSPHKYTTKKDMA
jgi:hypothetical protein